MTDTIGNVLSANQSSGLLQLRVAGVWKWVCDNDFDQNGHGADVAGRELGFASGTHSYGVAPADLFYDGVKCTGAEASLADCPRSNGENCGRSEAVALSCVGMHRRQKDRKGRPEAVRQ